MTKKVIILGGIGNGSVIANAIIDANKRGDNTWQVEGYINDRITIGEKIEDLPVLGKTNEIKSLSCKNIEVTGYVEDLNQIYASARIAVAPIRYGAGVKGKIVNSLSYGIPVVTTSVGLEGMGLTHNINCLCADSVESFVSEVVSLMEDDKCWTRLSKAGLEYVENVYSETEAKRCMTSILK